MVCFTCFILLCYCSFEDCASLMSCPWKQTHLFCEEAWSSWLLQSICFLRFVSVEKKEDWFGCLFLDGTVSVSALSLSIVYFRYYVFFRSNLCSCCGWLLHWAARFSSTFTPVRSCPTSRLPHHVHFLFLCVASKDVYASPECSIFWMSLH